MTIAFNRGKARIAAVGWGPMDSRLLILAHANVLPVGAENPDLNTVAELLAVAGVTEAAEVGALVGYQRKALVSEVVIEDDAGDVANLDAADIPYGATESGRWVAGVVYEEGANDAARNLISLHTFPAALVTNGSTVNVTVNVAGLFGLQ